MKITSIENRSYAQKGTKQNFGAQIREETAKRILRYVEPELKGKATQLIDEIRKSGSNDIRVCADSPMICQTYKGLISPQVMLSMHIATPGVKPLKRAPLTSLGVGTLGDLPDGIKAIHFLESVKNFIPRAEEAINKARQKAAAVFTPDGAKREAAKAEKALGRALTLLENAKTRYANALDKFEETKAIDQRLNKA